MTQRIYHSHPATGFPFLDSSKGELTRESSDSSLTSGTTISNPAEEVRPIATGNPPLRGGSYTHTFFNALYPDRRFYIYQGQKTKVVELTHLSEVVQMGQVVDANQKTEQIFLSTLKRSFLKNDLLLVRQEDGRYALGKVTKHTLPRKIEWVGSDTQLPLQIGGQHGLYRYIPITEQRLAVHFIRSEDGYRVSEESDQLIPAYSLILSR